MLLPTSEVSYAKGAYELGCTSGGHLDWEKMFTHSVLLTLRSFL